MGDIELRPRARRVLLLLVPAALATRFVSAQSSAQLPPPLIPPDVPRDDGRLPNGKLQREEILKADYEKSVKDARGLIDLAKSFEEDLEKNDKYVFSLPTMKKLDEMEKVIRRIRDRLRKT
jgi:hypothetical protein